jgi:hypothetical protein
MQQAILTPAMGKRLIGRAVAEHPAVRAAMKSGTIVVVAGTTNAYVAEEILAAAGQAEGFTSEGFRRGVVVPPGVQAPKAEFPGDVVLVRGQWERGKQIFDVVGDLVEGDVVVKGANAVDPVSGKAGVLIGDPRCGTAGALLPAVVGGRVRLLVPVGLEKRVFEEIGDLAELLNVPGASGPRMLELPGEVITELDALAQLTGCEARLVAGGGVCGAEGSLWIAVTGGEEQVAAAGKLIGQLRAEPPCQP